MGFGCAGAYNAAWIVLKAVCYVLAVFVFSVVFWATKYWLEKPKKK